jgi:hypothetical protein
VQGRACVQLAQIPTSNLFLYTLPDATPFFDQPWLAQLAMFGVSSVLGHAANTVVLALLLVLAFGLVMDAALRNGAQPSHVAWVALLGAPLLAIGSGVRTQMFAYPCFACLVWLVVERREKYGAGQLALAGGVSALWANVHGSFVLAPLILGLPALSRFFQSSATNKSWAWRRGALALFYAGCLGTLLNPRGPFVYAYVLRYGGAVQATGTTDVTDWQALSWTSPLGAALLVLFVASAIALVLRRRYAGLGESALLLLLGLLSFTSQRFLCWWVLTGIAVVSPLLHPLAKNPSPRGLPGANLALLSLLALVLLLCLPGQPLYGRAARGTLIPYGDARGLSTEVPPGIGETLAHGFRGHLFHDQALGGFVEWVLAEKQPKPVAFVDQRFELTPAQLWRDYFAICEAERGWQALLARYQIDGLLVHESRAAPLILALTRESEWRLSAREYGYRLYTREPPR